MPRSRNIKPGFFKDDQLAELPVHARLLYAGLWCLADRDGVLEYRPKRIKAEVLPYDSVQIEKLLEDLASARYIVFYEADGCKCIYIPTFCEHQNPHKNEPPSKLPRPPKSAENAEKTGPQEITRGLAKKREDSASTPADSLNLIPDSLEGGAAEPQPSRGKGFDPKAAELPHDSPELREAWCDFCDHRREIKKKLTPTSCRKQLAELGEMDVQRAVRMINHTIAKGWTGLREPDQARGHPPGSEAAEVEAKQREQDEKARRNREASLAKRRRMRNNVA